MSERNDEINARINEALVEQALVIGSWVNGTIWIGATVGFLMKVAFNYYGGM